MVEAVGGAAASVRSVNGTAIATAIATALPIHKSRNVSAEARELEPPLLAGAGFLAPPFGFGLLPFPIVAKLERARDGALGVFDPDRSPPILCVSFYFIFTVRFPTRSRTFMAQGVPVPHRKNRLCSSRIPCPSVCGYAPIPDRSQTLPLLPRHWSPLQSVRVRRLRRCRCLSRWYRVGATAVSAWPRGSDPGRASEGAPLAHLSGRLVIQSPTSQC